MTHISHEWLFGACPVCLTQWEGPAAPDGRRTTLIHSVYDRALDRTVAYTCPTCGATWDRDTGNRLGIR